MPKTDSEVIMPASRGIAREGYPFLLAALIFSVIVWFFLGRLTGVVSLVVPLFVAYFFRDPERLPFCEDDDEETVLSPADGKVIIVSEVEEQRYLKKRMRKISIFMSVFNVHVNRIPFMGRVRTVQYNPGKFLIGYAEKASLENEQNAVVIEGLTPGREVLFVQIAGLIARRIVCYLKGGETVQRGERFGLIRFGSRVDVYLPIDCEILVQEGMIVRSGETPLARLGH